MLDREKQDIYYLNIVVTDGKNENQTVVTLNVLDVNDNSPQFNESLQEIYVVEGQVASSFYVVTAYDLDEPNNNNSKISFSLQKENGK